MRKLALLLLTLAATQIAASQPVVTPPPFTAQNPTLGTLPNYNDTSANWKNAGLAVIGGIPNRSTQCGATLNPSGVTTAGPTDDFNNLTAKIASCTAGQVLQLGSGTFNFFLSELPIVVNKGITIRGSGSTTGTCNAFTGTPCWGTVLQTYDGPQPTYNPTPQCGVTIGSTTNCPNTNGFFHVAPQVPFVFGWAGCVPAIHDPTAMNCGATIAADVAQGATKVQVSSTTNFSVGMWVLIDEWPAMVSTVNPTGGANILASPEFLNTTGSPAVMRLANPDGGNNMAACTGGGNPGYSFCINRLNEEIHKITAIGVGSCPGVNCTLTFDDPVTMAYRQSGSHDARVYWPTINGPTSNPFLEQAGIENLTINRVSGGAINFTFCAYCWVKNVEVNYWIAGAVNFTFSARGQVTGSYLHNCVDCQNNGAEYPIGISVASTEVLIDNNIILFGGKGMVGRAANTAVVAYNYVDKTFYEQAVIGDYLLDLAANGSHYGGTHHFLLEGNWSTNCDGDETHGNAIYHTFFRNHCTTMRTTFVDPSNSLTVNDCAAIGFQSPSSAPNPPGPLRAFGPMALNYWYAFVGNVGGQSGMQSCASAPFVYESTSANAEIWKSGWTGFEWPGPDANLNGVSNRFIFRHGNYDYVNASIVDHTAGFSHALPNSYYTGSRPAFFGPGATCTYPWPWVTPAGGSPIQTNSCSGSGLPAKARFDAGTPFVQP